MQLRATHATRTSRAMHTAHATWRRAPTSQHQLTPFYISITYLSVEFDFWRSLSNYVIWVYESLYSFLQVLVYSYLLVNSQPIFVENSLFMRFFFEKLCWQFLCKPAPRILRLFICRLFNISCQFYTAVLWIFLIRKQSLILNFGVLVFHLIGGSVYFVSHCGHAFSSGLQAAQWQCDHQCLKCWWSIMIHDQWSSVIMGMRRSNDAVSNEFS